MTGGPISILARSGWLVCLMLAALSISCAPKQKPLPAGQFDQHLYGPTELSKVENGYELKNRVVRAVISETSGNVTYWGSASGGNNLLLPGGIFASVDSRPSSSVGYIEKRDDETWQYFGDDADGFTWRKIYCLQGDNLFVTYILQNRSKETREVRMNVRGEFNSMKILDRTSDRFEGRSRRGTVTMRAFNEKIDPFEPPPLPVLLVSDTRSLKPDERISFTTQWTVILPDMPKKAATDKTDEHR